MTDKTIIKEAESMYGERIDFNKIDKRSGWKAFGEHVQLISEKGDEILATIPLDVLITCWIEKEKEDFKSALKRCKEEKQWQKQ